MVLHIILRHFKGKIVVCSRCQLLISINVSSKIKIYLFLFYLFIYFCLFVCIDHFLWRIITFKNLFNHSTIQSYYRRFDQSISWPIDEPFILWNKHQAVIKNWSIHHPSTIKINKLIHPSISASIHLNIHLSTHLSIHPSIHPSLEFGTLGGMLIGNIC